MSQKTLKEATMERLCEYIEDEIGADDVDDVRDIVDGILEILADQ